MDEKPWKKVKPKDRSSRFYNISIAILIAIIIGQCTGIIPKPAKYVPVDQR